MSFQGHIENGGVVLDNPVPLPDGTVVRIEPVEESKAKADSPVLADTDQTHTTQQMAHAWNAITKSIRAEDVALPVDPDDYPLF
jgi:hypothetical protein